MPEKVVCFITAPTPEEAEKIAESLVKGKLAACCTVIKGVLSIYEWEGKLNRAEECQIIAKTSSDRLPALIAETKRLHSYDVPEIISVPVTGGLPEYLDWIGDKA